MFGMMVGSSEESGKPLLCFSVPRIATPCQDGTLAATMRQAGTANGPKIEEMANQELYYYLSDLQARPKARRWWPTAIAICAVLGGIYGAAVGSAIGAVPGAADVIEIAAGVMAVICGIPGARFGSLIGVVTRNRFGKVFLGMFSAIGGAILGGLLATMIVLALGAILGAVGGWVFARALPALRHGNLRRFLVGIVGAVLGMFLGAILWAIRLNQAAALAGAAWGLGIGVVVGPLLLLMVIGALNSLANTHVSSRRDVVDATFQKEDQGGHPATTTAQGKGNHGEEA
jgi:hypothetical protein